MYANPQQLHTTFKLPQPIAESVVRILRPLVRILLRLDVSCYAVVELVRWVYVDVAMSEQEFVLPHSAGPTKSRASLLTGLSRREVHRLYAMPAKNVAPRLINYTRHGRVVSGWLSGPPYSDSQGQPKAVPIKARRGPSFHGLVRDFGGDIPYRTILNEFLERGWVKMGKDKTVKLMKAAYTRSLDPDIDRILGRITKRTEKVLDEGGQTLAVRITNY